jgi:hypothetical protein
MRSSLLELSAEELLSGLTLDDSTMELPVSGLLLDDSAEELVKGIPYIVELMRNSLLDELYSGVELLSPPATDIVSPQLAQNKLVSAIANFSICL